MKIQIIGNGAFGSFLSELLAPHMEIVDDAEIVILAVPLSAYDEVARRNREKHLVNVCSVQLPSTEICLEYTNEVISIHPLFGRRTPSDRRNSILTHEEVQGDDQWYHCPIAVDFLDIFSKVSSILKIDQNGKPFTPESHDLLMAKTHYAAVLGAKQLKVLVDRNVDVPDELLPNSFRLMRDFVKTLEDMPQGTIESIMGNPFV